MYTLSNSNTGVSWLLEEKESLMKRIDVLEKALASTIAENRVFHKMFAANTTKVDTLTGDMKQFKERYGTGKAENPVVVRQKYNQMNRADFKNLVLEDKDIVKVNTCIKHNKTSYYNTCTLH